MSEFAHTRTMQESDIERIAEIHVAAWRIAYEGIVRRERMDSLSVAAARGAWRRRFGAAHTSHIVCEWDGELVGFVSYGPMRDVRGRHAEPGVAELYALYVHPDRWGRGCGMALLDAVLARLRDEWDELLQGTDVCYAPVLDFDEAPRHPHNRARQAFIEHSRNFAGATVLKLKSKLAHHETSFIERKQKNETKQRRIFDKT